MESIKNYTLLMIVFLLLQGCSNHFSVGYTKVCLNDSSFNQMNIFTFHKGYITQATLLDTHVLVRNYDVLFKGDSLRYENYSYYRANNAEFMFDLDSVNNCILLKSNDRIVRYCK